MNLNCNRYTFLIRNFSKKFNNKIPKFYCSYCGWLNFFHYN